jgi:hypothetical protein
MDSAVHKFTSERAKHEFEGKFEYIFTRTEEAILQFVADIETMRPSNRPLSSSTIQALKGGIPPHIWKRSLLESFVDSIGARCKTVTELILGLRRLLGDYREFSLTRRAEIERRIKEMEIECWLRLQSYPDIERSLDRDGIQNDNDVQIILDAHDLCCNLPNEDITFVTVDREDIKAHENIILRETKLKGVWYLGDRKIAPGSQNSP